MNTIAWMRWRWRSSLAAIAGVAGGLGGSALGFFPGGALLLGWDVALLAYLLPTLAIIIGSDCRRVRQIAGEADEGRVVLMGVILTAVLVSVAAIVYAVHETKGGHVHRWTESTPVLTTLSLAALVLGWTTIQSLFTLHYAHRYFGDRDGDGTADEGIKFPGDPPDTYRDFLYVAICIGATCQVSDFNITDRKFRDLVTTHAALAFVYNTMVLALGINIFASLMG